MAVKVASEWLNSCSGCEIAILNLGETLLDVLEQIEFVHMPALLDHKYFGQKGEREIHKLEIPKATVGIISGGIRNEEHVEVAEAMRRNCDIIVALGTCATHGGIPALINQFSNAALFDRVYRESETTDPHEDPADPVLPVTLDRSYALDEKIHVDLFLPGCPPHPDWIEEAIRALLEGRAPQLPEKSVCDTCPTIKEGKGKLKKLHRFTRNAHFDANRPVSAMRCLLEQGLPCMGPVTRAGCAGRNGEAPQCIRARVPCQGCYGPVKRDGNQLLDYLNALASNQIDLASIIDRSTLLEFSGAHGLLRSKAVGKQ
ncbi:MAG: methyl viologen-reducing hydrogenase [Deltaproteobacteria bacterium]|nr:methyl viologen-reducing hydrogenase [Deltaproteobacteria bacterium]